MDPLRIIQQTSERQLGLVLVEQVRAAGLTRSALRHSVACDRFERLTRRVLRARGAPPSDRQSVLAAVLDASPRAFACGATAAALWGVPGYRLTPVHVARPAGLTGRRSDLATLHELADLRAEHVTVLDHVPIVRPELVVLQLCASEHPDRAARALDNLWRRRLTSGSSLRRTLDELAKQGRNGVRAMRELLDERGDDYVPPDSNLERRFEAVLRQACEPGMRRQVVCGDDRWVGRVDFRDPQLPLVVEVQSELYHSALTDRAADAARVAALRSAGFEVVEVSEEQVWHRPAEVVQAVRAARRRLTTLPPESVAPAAETAKRTRGQVGVGGRWGQATSTTRPVWSLATRPVSEASNASSADSTRPALSRRRNGSPTNT
jgi:very-short-patch-repair endonuclease